MLPAENISNEITENLRKDVGKYTTIDIKDENGRIKLYNSLQNCDYKIVDLKGQIIEFNDMYIERTNVEDRDENDKPIINEVTGEVKTKAHYRSILYGTDGKTYVSSAYGVFNSLSLITSIFGMPSKTNPLKVKVSERATKTGKGKSLILLVVNDNDVEQNIS